MKNSVTLIVLFLLGSIFTEMKAQYAVGDIYNKDGVKGIVVHVTDGGLHGLVMSLDYSVKKWLADKDAKFETHAFFEDDGMKNMNAIERYIGDNGKSWSDFPVFEWSRSLGDGWYIPAKDELDLIAIAVNGGAGQYDKKAVKAFNKKLKEAKGKSIMTCISGIKDFRWMYSSTETDYGMVQTLKFMYKSLGSAMKNTLFGSKKNGKLICIPLSKRITSGKLGSFGSRAVHKF